MKNSLKLFGIVLAAACFVVLGQSDLFAQNDPKMEVKQGDFVQSFMRANISYKKGEELYKKGDMAGAEQELTNCLEIAPTHAEASFILAQIRYKSGKAEQALADITQAETNFVKYSEFKAFAKEDHITSERDKATRIDEKLRELEGRLMSAGSVSERNSLESQIDALRRDRLDLADNPERPDVNAPVQIPARFLFVHGNVLLKLKKPAEAVAQYDLAIKSDPKYVNAYNNLASIYLGSKNPQKAMEYIDAAEAKGLVVNADLKKEVLKALGR